MQKILRQVYTQEFKEQAVQRVNDGKSISATAKELDINEQSLRNWVKAASIGKLTVTDCKVITPEAMELSRLRAEVARLKIENEIIKKQQRTSHAMCCEVRRDT